MGVVTPGPRVTHEVRNQVPVLAGHDVAADPALLEAVDREGAGWAAGGLHELGLLASRAQTAEQARLANEHPPVLRTHDRHGNRIDEVEFHPAWHALMDTAVSRGLHAAPWADPRPGAHVARAAKFYVWTQAEAGPRLPDLDDLRRGARTAARPRPGGQVRAAAHRLRLRSRAAPGRRQAGPAVRHGHDREAGRLRRPGEHHPRGARTGRRRRVPTCSPGTSGSAPRPCATCFSRSPRARRTDLFPAPPGAARRRTQRHAPPTAQGQARQPVQRLGRDRVRRRAGLAGRRGRPGRGHDHRDGQRDQARLRPRQRSGHAPSHGRGGASRQPPAGVRQGTRRAAADGERARRPEPGIAGRHRARLPPGRRGGPGGARRRGRGGTAARGPARGQVLGVQARARRTRPRRSNASAATGTWRSPACPGSTGRPR